MSTPFAIEYMNITELERDQVEDLLTCHPREQIILFASDVGRMAVNTRYQGLFKAVEAFDEAATNHFCQHDINICQHDIIEVTQRSAIKTCASAVGYTLITKYTSYWASWVIYDALKIDSKNLKMGINELYLNMIRNVVIDKNRTNKNITHLVQLICKERDFGLMGVLADALEDVGYDTSSLRGSTVFGLSDKVLYSLNPKITR